MVTDDLKKSTLMKRTFLFVLTQTDCKGTHTCALQHLAFSKRMASVRKQFSVVLPVIPGGKLWKTGVGTGPLEPINWRKSFLGDTGHFGYVVMPAETNRVPMSRQ